MNGTVRDLVEAIGILSFAVTGMIVARRKGVDAVGTFLVALFAGLGGGTVTVQKTAHREYDHRGILHDVTFHSAIGACTHALRHRVIRIDHTGRRTVLSEAVTEYATV